VLIFIRSANWYFEVAWMYYSSPGIVFFAVPLLTLVGSIALWPPRARSSPPRTLLTVLFGGIGTFVLYHLWAALSRVACEVCSGPAL
jgi:predicted membrane channel-forming protein YqfA (hemolysin III family)